MSLLINIRQVEGRNLVLQGELACTDLGWETRDELIRVTQPLHYDLEVQKAEQGLLVQGRLQQALDCECVRCLKPFTHVLIEERWSCLVELDGEDAAPVKDDCVDLTPYLRDDIFLAFPQHPLCDPQCNGLADKPVRGSLDDWKSDAASTVWDELNKLKL